MGEVDLWSLITVVTERNRQVEELVSIIGRLPPEQQAELIKRVLKSSDLNITFGNNQLSGTIIVQINTMDQSALADILQAIALRIATEPALTNTTETNPPLNEELNADADEDQTN